MNFGTIQVADIFVGTLNATEAYFGTEKVWEKSAPPPTANWLCFTAEEANSTVSMYESGVAAPTVSLEYSTDLNTWSPLVIETTTVTPTIVTLPNIGDKVWVRATSAGNTRMAISPTDCNIFKMTGKIAASGNVDTLLDQNGNATITNYCYNQLFYGCKSLTTAPELPATTLADYCYRSMFDGCSSLTTAPELPATTLADYCYNGMFRECTSLTSAPALPATTLAERCYNSMFNGCTSLTTAPALPATTLANECYRQMFNGCANLNIITLGYTGNFADAPNSAFKNWVNGVAASGTFYYNGSDTTQGASAIPTGWTVMPIPGPLCFTAGQVNSTVHLDKSGTPDPISLEYSYDKNTWTDYSWSGNTGDVIRLANVNDKVYFRAKTENQTISKAYNSYYKFIMSGSIAASGNIQTLLKADGSRMDAPANCYRNMFNGCTSLTTAPELPATTLASNCYDGMFMICSSLTSAPELPATTLADYCYNGMFMVCSSLTSAPALPATTLADSCYYSMFSGCTALTSAPSLPATSLASSCYNGMFQGCTSLTSAPSLPATTLASYCYGSMFYGCSSLTTAPELPATTLADYCYQNMFSGCSSLTTAPELPAETLAYYCYAGMFSGCSSLTEAPELSATSLEYYCYAGMFGGCEYLTTAPELPATSLAEGCYYQMFNNCISLTTAPELPATDLSYACYNEMFYQCSVLTEIKIGYTGGFSGDYFSDWVSGVASSGTFYYNGSDTTEGDSAIPSGWTVTPF